MYQNWKAKVAILQEGLSPLLRCYYCGIHMPAASYCQNKRIDKRERAIEMLLQKKDVELAQRLREMEFGL